MAGYAKLATFMTETCHGMVRRYDQLALRDLLYLQAELCHLEIEYASITKTDALKQDERQFYNGDWRHLQASEARGFGDTSVLQHTQVASLPRPKELERSMLHTWIDSATSGGGCGFLGRDLGGFTHTSVYDKVYERDLVMLNADHGEDDVLTKLMLGPVLTAFHWLWRYAKAPLPLDPQSRAGQNNRSSMYFYSDAHIRGVVYVFGTVASSLMPMASIVALSFADNTAARLSLVCGFTLLFSLSLALATRARRIEIFAATAAFAGVQVFFLGVPNTRL
ncbi:hypothetical protein MMC14_008207 [Varicellaria rhodocarpa]|nr:hypothetical protein [Varicellaria rhodocarpa]